MKRQIKTALWGILLFSVMAADLPAQHFTPSLNQTIFNDSMPVSGIQGVVGGIGSNIGIGIGQIPSQPQTSPITDMRYRGPIGQTGGTPQMGIGISPPQNTNWPSTPITDTMYRGPIGGQPQTPITDMMYRGPINGIPATGGPAIPGQDFLRGNVPTPFPVSPVPVQNVRPFPGSFQPNPGQIIRPGSGPNLGFPGQPRIPQSFQAPQPQNHSLLNHNQNQTLIGDTHNDGRGGSMHGSIGTIEEANLGLVAEPGFAGVRGGARGGISAQGQVQQIHDFNGVPIHQTASGNVFLGAEANAQAGLSHQGLGAGAGGFVGARAQLRRGVEVGGVNVGQTVEAQLGLGAEANAHLGLQNGRLRINGELGAALGVGAKAGVDAEVDFGETGRFVEQHGSGVIRDVGNSANDVSRWGNKAGQDINRTTNTVKNDAKKTANKVGSGIKKLGNSLFGK